MTPILKRNLVAGQRFFYFNPVRVDAKSLGERKKGSSTKVIEIEFSYFIKSHNGTSTRFFEVKEDGTLGKKVSFYDSIKGLLFHTREEAEVALKEQIEVAETKIKSNLRREIKKLQARLDDMEGK